jgi:hypothetical protein
LICVSHPERKKATFEVEKLTNILDGGKKQTLKRRWIISPTEDLEERIKSKYFWERPEALKEHLRDFIGAHEKFWAKYVPTREEVGWMSENSMNGGSLMNHYGLFLPTVRKNIALFFLLLLCFGKDFHLKKNCEQPKTGSGSGKQSAANGMAASHSANENGWKVSQSQKYIKLLVLPLQLRHHGRLTASQNIFLKK